MLLEIENLSYVYAEERAFTISLTALSLEKGQVCALTGVSGSGKSTLLECIGLLRPQFTATKFCFEGEDLSSLSEAQKARRRAQVLGYMPQSGGLLPYLSFEDNLKLQIRLAHGDLKRSEVNAYIDALMPQLKRFDMDKLLKLKPHQLSIGQRQRAVFFRALAHRPQVVLIDEPTSALDPVNAEKIFESIIECAKSLNIAVLVVTHDTEAVIRHGLYNCAYDGKESSDNHSVFKCMEQIWSFPYL